MTIRLPISPFFARQKAANDNQVVKPVILALDCVEFFDLVGPIPLHPVTHLNFAGLTPATLRRLAPTTVVMPLIFAAQDAIDVIAQLEAWAYAGRIVVIAPALPDSAMVQAELRALGPQHRLTLIAA